MTAHTTQLIALFALCWNFLLTIPLLGNGPAAATVFDLIESDPVRSIRLETDMAALQDKDQLEYQSALITIEGAQGQREWLVAVKKRGRFRLMNCDFAPLKLKFPKKELFRHGLQEHNKLKLVTHCLSNEKEAMDNLLREYLAYQAYETLTEKSYRAQLVRITYADTHHRFPESTHYGIILEDTDEMAHRAGGLEYETYGMEDDDMQPAAGVTMQLFQYMIGNADYSIPHLRNVKLVQDYSDQTVVPVPYDFDFSGWVNARYAIPLASSGAQSVKDRIWVGVLPSYDELAAAFDHFKANRSALEALVTQQKDLSERSRKELLAYLDRFYEKDVPRLLQKCPLVATAYQPQLSR
jgi:hypothetical protein